jgi:hypothetical protein
MADDGDRALTDHLALCQQRIRESPDPGGYLCGFSYATSLKWADIAAKERESPPRPVLFVHVRVAGSCRGGVRRVLTEVVNRYPD